MTMMESQSESVVLSCASCGTVIRVAGDLSRMRQLVWDHPLWRNGLPCVTFGCSGNLEAKDTTLDAFLDLTPEQLFRALCGGGTPEEIKAHPEVVGALLRSYKVSDVDVEECRGDGRAVLKRLYLENGLVLHLSGAPSGALVFKITKPVRTCAHAEQSDLAVPENTGDNELQRDRGEQCGNGGPEGHEHGKDARACVRGTE